MSTPSPKAMAEYRPEPTPLATKPWNIIMTSSGAWLGRTRAATASASPSTASVRFIALSATKRAFARP